MPVVPACIASVFFLLGLLNFNTTQNLLLWKLSIGVTEYGHWLIAPALTLLFFSGKDLKLIAGILASVVLLSLPLVQFAISRPHFEKELVSNFGKGKVWGIDRPSMSSPVKPMTRVYSTLENGETLALDFYPAVRPTESTRAAPWILVLHGGGWNSGERSQFSENSMALAERGYSVASISYRLAPKYRWPAPKEDVLKAVDYLQTHAAELDIDPDHWVILGRSAGGQIAESVAYSGKVKGLRGCIAFYAPADLNFAYEFAKEDDILKSPSLLRDYLGGTPISATANFNDASPIRFVGPGSPPTLLFHGPRDPLVWYRQSERLLERLRASAVPAALIRLPWATHGFDYSLNGPGGRVATAAMDFFLKKVLL